MVCIGCSGFFGFFLSQKTAYEVRISDWSSDVCSSDLAGERAVPADATGAGIGLVVADQRDGAPGVVLVGKLDGGAEPDAVLVELRRGVDDARGLHAPGEEGEAAVDLTRTLAAIGVVAIRAAVAVTRGPTDDTDQLRAFVAEQRGLFGAQRGEVRRADDFRIFPYHHPSPRIGLPRVAP